MHCVHTQSRAPSVCLILQCCGWIHTPAQHGLLPLLPDLPGSAPTGGSLHIPVECRPVLHWRYPGLCSCAAGRSGCGWLVHFCSVPAFFTALPHVSSNACSSVAHVLSTRTAVTRTHTQINQLFEAGPGQAIQILGNYLVSQSVSLLPTEHVLQFVGSTCSYEL